MTEVSGMNRMRRTLLIHRVVQLMLSALLLYMALLFQDKFMEKYASLRPFYTSLVLTLLIQAAVFFPVRTFAGNDARRELRAAFATALNSEEQKQLRSQRLFSDFLKASIFLFFVAFILLVKEQATIFQSTAFFSCIATVVSYLQIFNRAVQGEIDK